MEDKRMSFCLFGSRFLEKLKPYLEKRGHVIDREQIGFSPLGSCVGLLPREVDVSRRYLILDLRCLNLPLIRRKESGGEQYCTLTPERLVREESLTDPLLMEDDQIRKLFNCWLEKNCRHFMDSHILLICTYDSCYWVADQYLKHCDESLENKKELEFIQKWEAYLLKETGAVPVRSAQYYFLKKEAGYPLSRYIYEPECYVDIAVKVEKLAGGAEHSAPEYNLSLKRYTAYYDCTIMLKGFEVFLDRNNFIDSFVLASDKALVEEWKEELIQIRDRDWSQPRVTLNRLAKSCLPEELYTLLVAFEGISHSRGEDTSYKYKILFQKGIVSEYIMSRIRLFHGQCGEGAQKRINNYNAGYYWALMNGIDEDNACDFCGKNVTVKPTLVDVFGSCVSRVCFNERYTQNYAMSVLHMWWHVPLYESTESAVSYPEGIFSDKLNYKDRNVKLQFEHRIFEDIAQSEAEWLIVDLYSFIAPRTYKYGNLVYTDYDGKISGLLGAERVKTWGEESVLGDWEEISKRLQNWCKTVLEKYGDHIVLIETFLCDYWIGDDDKIYCFDTIQDRHVRNTQMQKAFQYLKDKLNCYTIEFSGDFLSDELGYSKKTDIHYELAFYWIVSRKIQYILENIPEQKCFQTYGGEIRLNRILRLRRNNSTGILKKLFPLELDDIVLQLPVEILMKNSVRVACWYDRGYKSKADLIYGEDFSDCPDILKLVNRIVLSDEMEEGNLASKYESRAEDKYLEPYMDKMRKNRKPIKYIITYQGNGADEGEMEPSLETRGVRSKLRRNQFIRMGYVFIGWKSYRKSDKRSCCFHEGIRRYFREDEKPPGAEEYLYPDEASFKALTKVNGDEITMSAVWKETFL